MACRFHLGMTLGTRWICPFEALARAAPPSHAHWYKRRRASRPCRLFKRIRHFDERCLTESASREEHADRKPERGSGGHGDRGVSSLGRGRRAAAYDVISIDEIDCPGGAGGRHDERVQLKRIHHHINTLLAGMRQEWERKRAVARDGLRSDLPDGAYAACSSAHTSPHRSWNRHRCSARDTVSFRNWRERKWSRSSSWAEQKRAAASKEPKPRMG